MTRLQNQIIAEQNRLAPARRGLPANQFDDYIKLHDDAFYDAAKYIDDLELLVANGTLTRNAADTFGASVPEKIAKYYEFLFEFERRGLHGTNPSRMRGGAPAITPVASPTPAVLATPTAVPRVGAVVPVA